MGTGQCSYTFTDMACPSNQCAQGACIAPSLSSKEFFLRKAIGWSLRQVARHDPNAVRRYVKENDSALSPLSKREAMKHQ